MFYSIGRVAKLLNVPASTLRFYDKEGLLPTMERTDGGVRRFKDEDFVWLRIIDCLKRSGMSLKEIRKFIALVQEGDGTIKERRKMFEEQRLELKAKIAELQTMSEVMDYKCWFYEVADKHGTIKAPLEMPMDKVPQKLRKIRQYICQPADGNREIL